MNISKVIGLQLRLARIEKGKTITWVANKLGVAKNTISYMELGKKKNVSVEDIVNYCQLTPTHKGAWLLPIKKFL